MPRIGALLSALLVVAAVGASSAVAMPTVASNRAAAIADAGGLLGRLQLPAGAVSSPVSPVPGPLLQEAGETPPPYRLIDRAGWWTVPGQPQGVLGWLEAHPPARSSLLGNSSNLLAGVPQSWSATFSWPVVAGVLSTRYLEVEVAPPPSGATGLRADAQSVWVLPRSRSERVPVSAWVLEVVATPAEDGAPRSTTIANPKAARRVAALVNSLPIVRPAIMSVGEAGSIDGCAHLSCCLSWAGPRRSCRSGWPWRRLRWDGAEHRWAAAGPPGGRP